MCPYRTCSTLQSYISHGPCAELMGWCCTLTHARLQSTTMHMHTQCKSQCNTIHALCDHAWNIGGRETMACHGKEVRKCNLLGWEEEEEEERGRGASFRSCSIFQPQNSPQSSDFADESTTSMMKRTRKKKKSYFYVCLLCVRVNQCKMRKHQTSNNTAALQRNLINKRNRYYLLPLESEVMNPVIFSLHTHRLRQVPSATKSARSVNCLTSRVCLQPADVRPLPAQSKTHLQGPQ